MPKFSLLNAYLDPKLQHIMLRHPEHFRIPVNVLKEKDTQRLLKSTYQEV